MRGVLVRREPDAGSYARLTLQRGSSESTIKAIVQDSYSPPEVLQLREIEPPNVADDEVLVRIRAASLHPDVWHVVRGPPYVLRLMGAGRRRPKHRVPGRTWRARGDRIPGTGMCEERL